MASEPEKARRVKPPALGQLWLQFRWPLVAALVLLLLAGLADFGLSRYDAWLAAKQSAQVESQISAYRSGFTGWLERRLADIDAALAASDLAGRLRSGGADAIAPELERISAARPDLLGIRYVEPGEPSADPTGMPPLGYAALEMIARSRSEGKEVPPEGLFIGSAEAHVAWVRPIGEPAAELGHLLLALPIPVLGEGLEAAARGSSMASFVEVEQVSGGKPVALASVGARELRAGPPAVRQGIAGSPWRISMWVAPLGASSERIADAVWAVTAALGLGIVGAMLLTLWRGRKADKAAVFGGAAARVDTPAVGAVPTPAPQGAAGAAEGEALPPELPATARLGEPGSGLIVEEHEDGEVDASLFGQSLSAEPPPVPPPKPDAAAKPTPPASAAGSGLVPDSSVFRAYDVRGVVGEGFGAPHVRELGRAIGSEAYDRGQQTIVVARDGRLSSPEFHQALIEGLQATGRDVIDIGVVPTPVLYFATFYLNTGSGVMVTGSHNPAEYNGLKIVLGEETLFGEDIMALRGRIESGTLSSGEGNLQEMDLLSEYIRRVSEDVPVALGNAFRIVIDGGNGVAGAVAPKLFRALGHDVIELYCDLDGSFPNHPPDTSDPANLQDLSAAVVEHGADIGFGFDGDGDRLAVVDGKGEIIWPDRLMMLYARDILSRTPGAKIVFDVKCSSRLKTVITKLGGEPIMWKTGHSYMKNKLKEEGAELAGEMSGHIFFRERWYGFDDAMYAAARLLEILMDLKQSPTEILAKLPNGVSTPELRVPLAEGEHLAFMERLVAGVALADAEITTVDGIRADYPDGWGLVRASNTTPALVFRFEGRDEQALARIQELFKAQVHAVDPGLELPF